MEFYDLMLSDYLKLDLTLIPQKDLEEWAYYIWCCHDDDVELMNFRETMLLPRIRPASQIIEDTEDDLDGE